jgi:hypothetical protein
MAYLPRFIGVLAMLGVERSGGGACPRRYGSPSLAIFVAAMMAR